MLHYSDREEEVTELHGHITSLSVLRSHRKLGIASRLMDAARKRIVFSDPLAHPESPSESHRGTPLVELNSKFIIT